MIPYSWDEEPIYPDIRWHTGDPETDPWEWRMRVLEQHEDIAYSKLFFKKSGYITREWYPYFLAVRRRGASFEEQYRDGTITHSAKLIYKVLEGGGEIPVHVIRQLAGFTGADKSRFDSAITELQMKMFITMCGRQRKISSDGEEYGWSSTVFCTTEKFFGSEIFAAAAELDADDAADTITRRVFELNPSADLRRMKKFIYGY